MSTKKAPGAKDLHKGHRERMRKRYLVSGFDGFSDHEILEFLLSYSVRQMNMNDTAHLLMNRFRSISGGLNASISELKGVPGIGDNSALLRSMMPKLLARYEFDRRAEKGDIYTGEKIKDFLLTHYFGESAEHSVLMLFDGDMRLIEYIKFDKGTGNHCDIDTSLLAEYVFTKHADVFVIAHNHPNGSPEPSHDDILFTRRISDLFRYFGKYFFEHYIVTANKVTAVKSGGYLN